MDQFLVSPFLLVFLGLHHLLIKTFFNTLVSLHPHIMQEHFLNFFKNKNHIPLLLKALNFDKFINLKFYQFYFYY